LNHRKKTKADGSRLIPRKHTETLVLLSCILSACFISRGAIFCRNGPHEHADCLALECAVRVFKCLAQAHSNDNTGRCRESHPSIRNRRF